MKLALTFLTLARVLLGVASATEAKKPNILILVADDLGYADIGANGCTDFATPGIDSIAQNGVRFTSGYVAAPVCSPSRAGLMTGRAPARFGHEFNAPLADRAPVGTGKSPEPPHAALFWRYGDQMAVREGDWKLTRALDTTSTPSTVKTGLFNLRIDVSEQRDLSGAESAKRNELQSLWDKWNAGNVRALWGAEAEPAGAGVKNRPVP